MRGDRNTLQAAIQDTGTPKDISEAGKDASESNIGNRQTKGGSQFKGEDYYDPNSVPDSIASQGNLPPDSIIEASKEDD